MVEGGGWRNSATCQPRLVDAHRGSSHGRRQRIDRPSLWNRASAAARSLHERALIPSPAARYFRARPSIIERRASSCPSVFFRPSVSPFRSTVCASFPHFRGRAPHKYSVCFLRVLAVFVFLSSIYAGRLSESLEPSTPPPVYSRGD